jgi:hypothetical protein
MVVALGIMPGIIHPNELYLLYSLNTASLKPEKHSVNALPAPVIGPLVVLLLSFSLFFILHQPL